MARTPKNHAAAKALGKRLEALHARYVKDNEPIGYERIARLIEFQFGWSMSGEQVRKYHKGENDPYAVAVEDLICFSKFYKVEPAKLGADADAVIKRASSLLGRSTGWHVGVPESLLVA